MKNLTFIDLFCGLGAMRLAFEQNNCKCVFSSEIDKYAIENYQLNFNEIPSGDITKITNDNIPNHDILLAGFPCQSFSEAGKKKGFEDNRGLLIYEILRILEHKKPKAFLLENVRGLLFHEKGKTFEIIKELLISVGYNIHYKVLNSLDFGVPQSRKRVYIVGFIDNVNFQFPNPIDYNIQHKSLSDILEDESNIDKYHYLSDSEKLFFLSFANTTTTYPSLFIRGAFEKRNKVKIKPYSHTLLAQDSKKMITVNGIRALTIRERLRLQGFPESYKYIGSYYKMMKLVGNSITVPVLDLICKEMLKSLGVNNKLSTY